MNDTKKRAKRFWKRWEAAGAIGTIPRTGCMPRTDFRYEELEGLLGSFYLTLLPLQKGGAADKQDFEEAAAILNALATRHGILSPKMAVRTPRAEEKWGQPDTFESCFTLMDMMGSFGRDFSIGQQVNTEDNTNVRRLWELVVGILHRHEVVEAEFEEVNGKVKATKVRSKDNNKLHQPLTAFV